MTKFAKARKFVDENRTQIAFLAGSILTSTVITIATHGGPTKLLVTMEQAELLKKGGAIVYELTDQTLHLVNVPALEAAQAAL